MRICTDCNDKVCLKSGKPCKEIEELLRQEKIFSRDYIRPKMPGKKRKDWGKWREIPFSSLKFKEQLFNNDFK